MKTTLKDVIRKTKATESISPNDWRSLIIGVAQDLIREKLEAIESELLDSLSQTVSTVAREMVKEITGPRGPKGDKGDSIRGQEGPAGPKPVVGVDYKVPKDGKNGRDGVSKDGRDGKDGKDGSPDKPKEIAVKLNTLAEAVDISVIKGLSTYLKNLSSSARIGSVKQKGGGGNVVKYHDLSAQLNGSTKTFLVPTHRRIIQVVSSSTPFIFRPVVDYSETRTSITFDSAVDAASMLAQGQSLTLIYAN